MRHLAVLAVALLAATALAGCGESGSEAEDSDGDGLSDLEETNGWGIRVETQQGTVMRRVDSDPGNPQTDGTGLADRYKFILGLDPHAADTDGDGLSDCQEVYHTGGADCTEASRAEWLAAHHDGGYGTIATHWDSDRDGVADGAEVDGRDLDLPGGRRHVRTDPLAADSDHDGLTDGQEARFGTDPAGMDTDGDGCKDGLDVLPLVQHARFGLDLESIAPVGSGTMRVRFLIQIAGTNTDAGTDQGWAVEAGRSNDLSGVEVPPVSSATCGTSPLFPWLSLSVLVERRDVADPTILDFSSQSNPDAAVQFYWNPHDGSYSWHGDGADPFSGAVNWVGADGALAFHPLLVPGQAS